MEHWCSLAALYRQLTPVAPPWVVEVGLITSHGVVCLYGYIWLHAALLLHCMWLGRPKERELDEPGVVAILSSLVLTASQIFLFFSFFSFFSLVKETKLISLFSCTQNLPRWHLLIVMHCGSVLRIEFSFSEFSIFRKFAFVFVSGFTVFAFVFVFKYKSRK
jgi:hypothetical protein